MVSNFRRSSQAWKKKAKTLDINMHFCGFSKHPFIHYLFFSFHWDVIIIIMLVMMVMMVMVMVVMMVMMMMTVMMMMMMLMVMM